MTQNVIMNGKVLDHQFHKYVNPIPEFNSWQSLPEHIAVTPYAVTQGTGPTIVTIKGNGFWPLRYALLNDKELETKFISRRELQTVIPADAIPRARHVPRHG
jgi:hypothetical protein